MFTGIITDIGKIVSVDKQGDWRLRIQTNWETTEISIGASIACSGICLTVVERNNNYFDVAASMETVSVTTLRNWQIGTKINLERALRMGDELGGHIVSGHVDGIATITDIKPAKDSHYIRLEIGESLNRLISLTVNSAIDNSFDVNIIAHTWQETTLGNREVGDTVNVEIDMLARYVARLLETK